MSNPHQSSLNLSKEESLLEKATTLYQEIEELTMEKVIQEEEKTATHERSDSKREVTYKEEEGLQVEEREKERKIEIRERKKIVTRVLVDDDVRTQVVK
ncbi:hypothetical protein LguiB_026659 [Lonicera macranthoides]